MVGRCWCLHCAQEESHGDERHSLWASAHSLLPHGREHRGWVKPHICPALGLCINVAEVIPGQTPPDTQAALDCAAHPRACRIVVAWAKVATTSASYQQGGAPRMQQQAVAAQCAGSWREARTQLAAWSGLMKVNPHPICCLSLSLQTCIHKRQQARHVYIHICKQTQPYTSLTHTYISF